MTKLFSLLFEVANPKKLPLLFHGMYAFTNAMEKVLGIQINWIEDYDIDSIALRKTRGAYTILWNPEAESFDFIGSGHDIFHLLTVNMVQHFAKKNTERGYESKSNVMLLNTGRLLKFLQQLETIFREYEFKYPNELEGVFDKYKENVLYLARLANIETKKEKRDMRTVNINLRDRLAEETLKLLTRIKENRFVDIEDRKKFLRTPFLQDYFESQYTIQKLYRRSMEGYFDFVFDNHFSDRTDYVTPQHYPEETIGNYVADSTTIRNAITYAEPITIDPLLYELEQEYFSSRTISDTVYKRVPGKTEEEVGEMAFDRGKEIFKQLTETLRQVLTIYNQNLVRMGFVKNAKAI